VSAGGPAGARAVITRSAEETERLGRALAPALAVGDVVALSGPLGSGKTCLVGGLAHGLGAPSRVRSPSFTLVNEYRGRRRLVHLDLYRLEPGDAGGLGLDELRERGVLVVEWGEKLPRPLLDEALRLEFELLSASERRIRAWADPPARHLLEAWSMALGAEAR
jgi:tRNA threonylcarbamoyladenosine biosynthesis protein TsaE